jgi:ribosomal protein S18 acetylase RimI-like enzyme
VYVFEQDHQIHATVTVHDENWFTDRRTLYLGRLGVLPSLKRSGIGSKIMNTIELLALQENYEGIQLDTAKPAEHLVNWYQRLGYNIVGETKFEGKTYESWIFEKLILRPY